MRKVRKRRHRCDSYPEKGAVKSALFVCPISYHYRLPTALFSGFTILDTSRYLFPVGWISKLKRVTRRCECEQNQSCAKTPKVFILFHLVVASISSKCIDMGRAVCNRPSARRIVSHQSPYSFQTERKPKWWLCALTMSTDC